MADDSLVVGTLQRPVIGKCASCNKPIIGGEGITVDPEGAYRHPACAAKKARA